MEDSIFAQTGLWLSQNMTYLVIVLFALSLLYVFYKNYRFQQFKKILLQKGFTERKDRDRSADFIERGKVGIVLTVTGRGKKRSTRRELFVVVPGLSPTTSFILTRRAGDGAAAAPYLLKFSQFLFPGHVHVLSFRKPELQESLVGYALQKEPVSLSAELEALLQAHLSLFLDPRVESFNVGEGEVRLTVSASLLLPERVLEVEELLAKLDGLRTYKS